MDLLIWHGYLLSGTGSNIHIQNISRELCRLGHNVHLFIQESDLSDYDFVSKMYIFNADNSALIIASEKKTDYLGDCIAYKPSILGLLPVFVYDDYEGFKVKTFLDLSANELELYKLHNIKAIDLVMDKAEIDAFIADHGVISPYFAKMTCLRRGIPYIVVIQGSDLEFTIKKSKRYFDLSREGIMEANSVIAVTGHIKRELNQLYNGLIDDIVEVIPSGVDLKTFVQSSNRGGSLKDLMSSSRILQSKRNNGYSDKVQGNVLGDLKTEEIDDETLQKVHKSYVDRAPDKDITEKLSGLSSSDKYVTFVGKLMVTKGAHLAIAAMGRIFHDDPKVKLVIVGSGDLREHLEILVDAIATRDIDRLFLISKMIDGKLDTRDYLSEFYVTLQKQERLKEYFDMSADIKKRVIFTGLLHHDQIKYLLAMTDIQLTLSIFPEAFGLVVLEGTACGAIPIVSNHSGLKDLLISLEEKSGFDRELFRLTLTKDAITHLAKMLERIFTLSNDEREMFSRKFSEITNSKYGWPSVAERLVEHIRELRR